MKNEFKKFIGQYLGPQKIKDIKEIKETTYLGNPKFLVTYENGDEENLPIKMIECSITKEKSDWTELREARVKPIMTELLTILTEAELARSEIIYITGPKMIESINLAFRMANEKLWGKRYDDVTMKDADEVLKQK